MSEENKNTPQSGPQGSGKTDTPFWNLNPAVIPTKLHTYTYNGKCEKRDKNDE